MSKILIVDDEEPVREELKDRLSAMGHEFEESACHEGALKLLKEIQFDLVLLDLAIPMKFEGVARVDHGKNLLERIVSQESAPPVIVITANGLEGHKLAVEMIDLGAATFVGKPFDVDPVEPKIKMVLERNPTLQRSVTDQPQKFKGGVLVLHEECIELCGTIVGGTRGNGYIRKIISMLMVKTGDRYPKYNGRRLAEGIGGEVTAADMASAIKGFRRSCNEKLGCDANDVIATTRGGYQLAEWIEVKLGREESPRTQIDNDKQLVLRQIKRHRRRTRKQISAVVEISAARIKAALSALDDDGTIMIVGSGATATYSVR